MQTYQDSATSQFWQFEDDVVVTESNGVYTFTAPSGLVLKTPSTLAPYTGPWPVPPTLTEAQTAQVALLRGGYANANAANISFTNAAGVTDTYQCDPASIDNLQNCLSGLRAAGAVPTSPIPFYWRSATNQNNPFTYADLENLSAAIAARGFANYNQLQTLIAKVKAAKKVSAVQAVVWINP